MRKHLLTIALLTALTRFAIAQTTILNTPITFECRQQPLGHVLDIIAATGNFYFSYSGTLFNKDSLVTLPAQTRSVRQLLDLLFHGRFQYLEDGRYLILLPATNKTAQALSEDRRYLISGTILDERTGQPLIDVSVYDPAELAATMSKKDGRFSVRIKNKGKPIVLAISKQAYIDTIIQLPPGASRDLTISISPDAFPPKALLLSTQPDWSDDSIHIEYPGDSLNITFKNLIPGVETTRFARIVLSYRLRVQSLNVKKLFVQRPIQLSFIPGWSTNGPLNSQVTNKFSINVIGGYEAGLKGVELGGAFNIDKNKVTGVQAAGVINVVGGPVYGVQLAGVCNKDLDSLHGFQAAGAINMAKTVNGMQLAVINTAKIVEGVQAGVINLADSIRGFQFGYFNHATQTKGVQWSLINHTRHLRGLQWGLINIADTSEGVSFGPINIIKHGGLHELSFYADELSPLNLAFRSGTRKAYGIIYGGVNPDDKRRVYYGGLGYGLQSSISHALAIRTEFTVGALSPFNLHNFTSNGIWRFNLDLHWQPAKNFAITFGPSLNLLDPNIVNGVPYNPLPDGYATTRIGAGHLTSWIGWHVAINLF